MEDQVLNQNLETQAAPADEIRSLDIVEELTSSYIDYAMSVIVARALPDVRDGLKPVQRRILYGMYAMGVKAGTPYKKVARMAGDVMGKYHPHGDASIIDALVRMGQPWNMRHTLIDGQGNFGSIDGDPHAAARYIEARLAKVAEEMLAGLDENTVDFGPNYDGLETEPLVLPALLPNLLVNGGEGIAVGMATKIPPHNLGEVVDAVTATINAGTSVVANQDRVGYAENIKRVADLAELPQDRFATFQSEIEIAEILKHIKGPDFPTAGEIFDAAEIAAVYETGRGRVLMRGITQIEEIKGGKYQIVITEIPYQVVKQRLIAKIAELVKEDKIKGISDIKDLSTNRGGMRIVIELKRDANPKSVENLLYKYTELQKAFNANIVALVDNEPQLLNVKQILVEFIKHRLVVVTRRNEYDLAKKREREHILEGLMIALDNLDEVINTIRSSKDADTAKASLISKFKLTEIQAQAILDMQLRRLAALERQKIEDEYKQIKLAIAELLEILASPRKVLDVILAELAELKAKYGEPRLTKVHKGKAGEISEEDLVAPEEVFVTISEQGYIKRIKDTSYQTQGRGGVGKKAMTTKEDDSVRHVFSCNTHDEVLFFTNKGRVFALRVYEIPEYSTRAAKGVPIINLIKVDQGELITSVLTRGKDGFIIDEDVSQEHETKTEHSGRDYKFLFMATKQGVVKKTLLSEYENIRSNGLIAINLDEGDELIWVKPTTGDNKLMLVTTKAKSILFHESEVRETGRASRGVRGINLGKADQVISMDVIRNKELFLLTLSELGFGKVTKLEQFGEQHRGGSGIFAARVNDKTGDLVAARVLDHPHLDLLIMSAQGNAVRVPTDQLPERNRQTAGVKMMKIKDNDSVAAIAII
jgi:DNA gyrase subunit A